MNTYDALAAPKVVDRLKELLNQLRELTAQRARELAALRDDATRTAEYKQQRGAAIAADCSAKADQMVTQSGARAEAESLLKAVPAPTGAAIAARGRFTTDGTAEPAWALYWIAALQRWPLGELEAVAVEAVADNRLGLAAAVQREAAARLEAVRAAGAAEHSAELAAARAIAEHVEAGAAPELLRAAAPLEELRQVVRLFDREWRTLRAPAVSLVTGAEAVAGAVDPAARLRAHRAAEAARA